MPASARDDSDDEGLSLALGMGFSQRMLATRRGSLEATDAGDPESSDREEEGVLAAMDRLGASARAKSREDRRLIREARSLARRGAGGSESEDEESEEESEEEGEAAGALALARGDAQGSRALQILRTNPQVKNAVSEHMFLPAIHKSLAPKIRTELKTSTFRPKLPAWAATKKEHLEITGDLESVAAALEANHKFQLDVRAMLEAIDDKLARNATLLTEVTRCKNRKGRRVHWSVQESMYELWGQKSELYFRVPSAWTPSQRPNALPSEDVTGLVSQLKLQKQITPNADQLRLGWANLVEKLPLSYASQCRTWTPKEDAQLRKGVHFQLQQARLLTDQRMSLDELAGMSLQPLSTLLVAGGLDVIARDAEAIEWEEVVRMHMTSRSMDDCRLRWMNVVDPRICGEDWTEQEDQKLIELAEESPAGRDWTRIAEELYVAKLTPGGLVRTPHQCAVRYQAEFNPNLVKSTWTPEEDATIREHVRKYGAGSWTKLARLLPGHTGQQILHRWRRIQPTRRVGAWTAEEDEALRVAVSAYCGGERIKWSLVQEHVPTRTDVQCRERWTNVLDPAIKTTPWEPEEDAALLSAIGPDFEESKFNEWTRLAEVVPGRTGKYCMRRVKVLLRKQRQDAEVATQKTTASRKEKQPLPANASEAVNGAESAKKKRKAPTKTKSQSSALRAPALTPKAATEPSTATKRIRKR